MHSMVNFLQKTSDKQLKFGKGLVSDSYLNYRIKSVGGIKILYFHNKILYGYLDLEISHSENKSYLNLLFSQKIGAGKSLMISMERYVQKFYPTIKYIELDSVYHYPTLYFYEKLGYVEKGEEHNDVIKLVKKLK